MDIITEERNLIIWTMAEENVEDGRHEP